MKPEKFFTEFFYPTDKSKIEFVRDTLGSVAFIPTVNGVQNFEGTLEYYGNMIAFGPNTTEKELLDQLNEIDAALNHEYLTRDRHQIEPVNCTHDAYGESELYDIVLVVVDEARRSHRPQLADTDVRKGEWLNLKHHVWYQNVRVTFNPFVPEPVQTLMTQIRQALLNKEAEFHRSPMFEQHQKAAKSEYTENAKEYFNMVTNSINFVKATGVETMELLSRFMTLSNKIQQAVFRGKVLPSPHIPDIVAIRFEESGFTEYKFFDRQLTDLSLDDRVHWIIGQFLPYLRLQTGYPQELIDLTDELIDAFNGEDIPTIHEK